MEHWAKMDKTSLKSPLRKIILKDVLGIFVYGSLIISVYEESSNFQIFKPLIFHGMDQGWKNNSPLVLSNEVCIFFLKSYLLTKEIPIKIYVNSTEVIIYINMKHLN